MFNATVNVGNGVSFQVSVTDTEVDIFKAIARIQSTFNFNNSGACNSTNVFFRVRTTENDEDYLEMVCPDCGARLPFGVTKKEKQIFTKLTWNSLSPKQQENRKDEEDYANSNNHFPYG